MLWAYFNSSQFIDQLPCSALTYYTTVQWGILIQTSRHFCLSDVLLHSHIWIITLLSQSWIILQMELKMTVVLRMCTPPFPTGKCTVTLRLPLPRKLSSIPPLLYLICTASIPPAVGLQNHPRYSLWIDGIALAVRHRPNHPRDKPFIDTRCCHYVSRQNTFIKNARTYRHTMVHWQWSVFTSSIVRAPLLPQLSQEIGKLLMNGMKAGGAGGGHRVDPWAVLRRDCLLCSTGRWKLQRFSWPLLFVFLSPLWLLKYLKLRAYSASHLIRRIVWI